MRRRPFLANGDGSWRRYAERHENTLVDAVRIADQLRAHGRDAHVSNASAAETLPAGLRITTGVHEK